MSEDVRVQEAAGRTGEAEITVAAPLDAVWRALAEGDELARWFPLEARVEPGVGGSVWLSWGGGWEGSSRIDLWEPGRRLRVTNERPGADGSPVLLAVDYWLEPAEGGTRVRVVHSGFGPGAEWDDELDAIRRGWKFELRSLRHYLERHAGTPRRVAWARLPTSLSVEEAWARVMGGRGLFDARSVGDVAEGDAYHLTGPSGEAWDGRVLIHRPPTDFSGTVTHLNDALLRYVHEVGTVSLWLATWGVPQSAVDELQRRWQDEMNRLLA